MAARALTLHYVAENARGPEYQTPCGLRGYHGGGDVYGDERTSFLATPTPYRVTCKRCTGEFRPGRYRKATNDNA